MQSLIKLRKKLHRNAELSGKEKLTAKIIYDFLIKYQPKEIINFPPSQGIAAVYMGKKPGKTILIRCELDALPIPESIDIDYGSLQTQVSHKCGHDGHMAIVSGLAPLLCNKQLNSGQVILLFQPAEETGEGAEQIIHHLNFANLKIDYVFALHNMPGYPLGEVLLRESVFCCASKGMKIKLIGKSAHAAEPQNSVSPIPAVIDVAQRFRKISQPYSKSLVTLTHINVGEASFGISPGNASIMLTLRSQSQVEIDNLSTEYLKFIERVALKHNLKFHIEWCEVFPLTKNSLEAVKIVRSACAQLGISYQYLEQPISWSEDFGHFIKKYSGTMFGLGSGKNQPPLHHPDYDFPDNLIKNGVDLFRKIIDIV